MCDGNTFESEALLTQHIQQHHQNSCPICMIDFNSKHDLSQHNSDNHMVVCDTCSCPFESHEDLEKHMLDSHLCPDDDGIYRCDECIFTSHSATYFKDHYKGKHGIKTNSIISKFAAIFKITMLG